MTSSPWPMFSAIKHASNASLPDETPMACEQPEYCATAFSHCSTFGPRMKCCDSMTSAIAASTSALMERYWALRSSNGTCMLRFLFQLSVRFAAFGELCGQRRLFVQVETAQHARFGLLVAIPALRTYRHAHRVR